MAKRDGILKSELMYDALASSLAPGRGRREDEAPEPPGPPGPPVITSSAAINYPENSEGVVFTITYTGGEGPVSFAHGGVDGAFFVTDFGTGEVSTNGAPFDFESPVDNNADGVFELQVTVDDGVNPPVVQDVLVTITNVIDPPVITSDPTFSVQENEAGNLFSVEALSELDLTYSIEGGVDGALFNINSGNGAVFFNDPPDFEDPQDADTDNVYELTVGVDDGVNPVVTQAVQVTVTDVAELVSARYWRMAEFTIPSGNLLENSEYQLYDSGGLANSAATITGTTPSFGTIADATDGSLLTRCYWIAPGIPISSVIIQWDFGSPRTITGIRVGSEDDAIRWPSSLVLEYSSNGTDWTEIYAGGVGAYPGVRTLGPLTAVQ